MQSFHSLRKIATMAAVGTATLGISVAGVGVATASAANGVQPVTFNVGVGALALAETPSAAIALVPGTATPMPDTTVTDGRNVAGVTYSWTATNVATDLTETGGGDISATNIAMAETGAFTNGTGTADTTTTPGTVATTGETINSVYVYTPTADLTVPANPNSGAYTGTVTQTVS